MVKEAGRKGAEFCFRGAEREGLVRALTVSARGGGAVGLVMGAEGGGSCRWCDPGGCAAWASRRARFRAGGLRSRSDRGRLGAV